MRLTLTAIVGIDSRFEFGCTQQAVWFRYGPLAMHPFRLNGVEPRTFAGQLAHDETHADRALLDLLIMLAHPALHGVTAMPGGVVPDQAQCGEALRGELGGAPRQQLDGHRTHGAPRDTPEPHLVCLVWRRPHQEPITGQALPAEGHTHGFVADQPRRQALGETDLGGQRERPSAGGRAERPWTLVQQRPQGLADPSVEDARRRVWP